MTPSAACRVLPAPGRGVCEPGESPEPRRTKEARQRRTVETPEERILWARLRGKALGGLHFRRKHPIGPYIVDFCCLPARLVVELDGFPPPDPLRDQRAEVRTRWLRRAGFTVLRFQNEAVHIELEAVLAIIQKAAERAVR